MANIPVKVTCVNIETLRRFTITGWGDDGPLVSTWLGTVNRRTLRFTQIEPRNKNIAVLDVTTS